MFRNTNDDMNGFVNKALDINETIEECNSPSSDYNSNCNSRNDTRIQITRWKYNQESLFREMVYRKSPSKSCKSCVDQLIYFCVYKH